MHQQPILVMILGNEQQNHITLIGIARLEHKIRSINRQNNQLIMVVICIRVPGGHRHITSLL